MTQVQYIFVLYRNIIIVIRVIVIITDMTRTVTNFMQLSKEHNRFMTRQCF